MACRAPQGGGGTVPASTPPFDGEADAAIPRVIDQRPGDLDFRGARGSPDSFIVLGLASYRATCIPAGDASPPAGDDS